MAENTRTPSLSLPSKNDSSEHNTESFDTLSNSSSVIGGASMGSMISLSNNDNCEEVSKTVIFEIRVGKDIVEPIIEFACRRRVGILVLTGAGYVNDVTLLHPLTYTAPALSITGHFNIISFTGTYISDHFALLSSSTPACSSFMINLSGFPSQVFGGIVGGKVIAASHVVVITSTFKNLEYHMVPSINESVEEVEEGDHTHVAIINADASDSNGIANNTVIAMTNNMSSFDITNSTLLNHQLPSP